MTAFVVTDLIAASNRYTEALEEASVAIDAATRPVGAAWQELVTAVERARAAGVPESFITRYYPADRVLVPCEECE